MMLTDPEEKPVAYMCATTTNGYMVSQDSRIYKRRGDAKKRAKRLNQNDNNDWEVLCAYGWAPLPEAGDTQ